MHYLSATLAPGLQARMTLRPSEHRFAHIRILVGFEGPTACYLPYAFGFEVAASIVRELSEASHHD
jgi:hypothetical protein